MSEFTPSEALARLKDGNQRFISGVRAIEPQLSFLKLRELAEKGQKPFAIVLTCSDSRSPAELVFDQGIGDLFVIRVAGNVVAPSLLASIEFAAANFATPLILVLGHTQCGAVTGALQHVRQPAEELPSPHLEELIGRIRPAVEASVKKLGIDHPDLLHSAVDSNVRRSMRLIREQSAIVRERLEAKTLALHGGVLDIATGQVRFFD